MYTKSDPAARGVVFQTGLPPSACRKILHCRATTSVARHETQTREPHMNLIQIASACALVLIASTALAAPSVNIIVNGEVAPGVYGRVEIGGVPPPPVFYPRPVVIVRPPPRVVVEEPIYLHVPPGHAKHWSKHCREYDACGRPVYFVRSAEYEPGYRSERHEDEREHGKGRGRGHGHDD
jgi:hypothetical protein